MAAFGPYFRKHHFKEAGNDKLNNQSFAPGSAGILRIGPESGSIRRRSHEPSSPAPSFDRLSVTFAVDDDDSAETGGKMPSQCPKMRSGKCLT